MSASKSPLELALQLEQDAAEVREPDGTCSALLISADAWRAFRSSLSESQRLLQQSSWNAGASEGLRTPPHLSYQLRNPHNKEG